MSIQVWSNEKPVTPPMADASAGKGVEQVQSKEIPSAPLVNTTEQNESSESEPEETEIKEGEESQDSVESENPSEPIESANKDQPKKKGGFQRRIDKLNARVSAKEQEAEFWKQQALKNAGATQTQVDPKVTIQAQATAGKPSPDAFDTHTEYVEALTEWKTEQKLKERDQKAEQIRLQDDLGKIVNTYTERMKTFAAKTADFNDVIAEVDHIPLSPSLRDIILTSDKGPELAYELAKDPAEYERIAKLPPLACAREIGKIEYRLNSSKTSAPEPKKLTQAPKPIEPVGTGGKGSTAKSIYDSSLSQKEYEAIRAKQRAKKTG